MQKLFLGEYSIPRFSVQQKTILAPIPPPPTITVQLSETLKNKLVHCADSIRGFGQRKLTEQEIGKSF